MAGDGIGSVSVDIVPNAENFWRRFAAQTSGQATAAGERARSEFDRGFNRGLGPTVRVRADTSEARAQIAALNREGKNGGGGGLLSYLLPLAPAIVPIAAAATAAAAGLATMGVTGILAAKGISNEMKLGTDLGKQYTGIIGGLKGSLASLEHTAAVGVFDGAQKSAQKLRDELPQLQQVIAGQAHVLGDVGQHLVGGLIDGFRTFAPMLSMVAGDVDRVAARFEAWASGPGGARFGAMLTSDYQTVVPVIEEVAAAIGHLLGASHGVGLGIVSELGLLARVIDSFPTPVLNAIITGFVAFKQVQLVANIARAASAGLASLSASVQGFWASATRDSVMGAAAANEASARLIASEAEAAAATAVARAEAAQAYATAQAEIAAAIAAETGELRGLAAVAVESSAQQAVAAQAAADTAVAAAAEAAAAATAAAEETAAAGNIASLGWKGVLGPLALVAVGVTALVTLFHHSAAASHEAADAAKAYTDALKGDGGGTKATLIDAITTQLTKNKLPETLERLNKELGSTQLSGRDFVNAIQERGTALKGLQDRLNEVIKAGTHYQTVAGGRAGGATFRVQTKAAQDATKALQTLQTQYSALSGVQKKDLLNTKTFFGVAAAISPIASALDITAQQATKYAQLMGIVVDKNGIAAVSQNVLSAAVERVSGDYQKATASQDAWLAAAEQFVSGIDTVASRATLIGQTLAAANGDMISFSSSMVGAATANQQLVTDLKNLKKGVLDLKTGMLDYHNAAAGPVINDLQALQTANMNAAGAVYQHELATKGGKQAADDAYHTYVNNTRTALMDEARQLGLTSGEAKKFADRYFGLANAKDLKKKIELIGTDQTLTVLKQILSDLDILAGKHVDTYVTTHYQNVGSGSGTGSGSRKPILRATGGWIHGPGTETSDSIWARVSKNEFIVNAHEARKNRGLLEAINAGARGFAAGGGPGETGGFTGVDYSGTANKYGVDKKKRGSGSGSSASNKPPTFDKSALASFLQQIGITTNAFVQAKDQLVTALLAAKVSHRQTAAVARMADRLIAYSEKIATETSRVDKARTYLSGLRDQSRQEASTVRSAFMSLFDLSNAGVRAAPTQIFRDVPVGKAAPVSGATILADLTTSANRAVTTRGELKSLENRAKGNPALTALVQQLAENPQSDQAQIDAFAHSSKGTLANIAKQYGRLGGAAGGAGADLSTALFGDKITAANALLNGFDPKKNPVLASAVHHLSDSLFGAGKETARGLAKGLIAERGTLVHAMHVLAHEMESTIRKDLKMRSPSRTFHEHGRNVVAGLVNGIVESLPHARTAAARLASTVQNGQGDPSRGRLPGGDEWHFHGLQDPVAIGTAVARRQRMLAAL